MATIRRRSLLKRWPPGMPPGRDSRVERLDSSNSRRRTGGPFFSLALYRRRVTDGLDRKLVGVTGFEPATPASRTQYSTRLSYTPNRTGAGAEGERLGKTSNHARPRRLPILTKNPCILNLAGRRWLRARPGPRLPPCGGYIQERR